MNIGFDNIFAFATIFGLLVFLHESGHFVLAKLSGIRVEVFSLGFGPRILGWRGEVTDYRISLVPLGGYVKMLGEEAEMDLVGAPADTEMNPPPAGSSFSPGAPSTPPDAFSAKPRWQRLLVMSAGAIMNLVLAFLIVAGMNMAGRREPAFLTEAPRLASVEPGSPAEQAGFQPGDVILSVNGKPTPRWDELQQSILFNPGRHITVRVERQKRVMDLDVGVTLAPEGSRTHRYRIGYIGLTQPAYDVKIWRVEPDSAAEKAGLAEGDIIRSIEDSPIYTSEDVVRMISARPDQATRIRVLRQGRPVDLLPTPKDVGGKGLLGIAPGPTVRIRELALGAALVDSLQQNFQRTGLFFSVVGKLLTGGLSIRAVSGPVDIFIFSGEALRRGWFDYFNLMALFSLQLGLLNLLPIPFLDGGHIAILGIEGILRRDLPDRLKERLLQIGFVTLLLFMGVVLYSDIAKNWFS